jgi:hypothetical protein
MPATHGGIYIDVKSHHCKFRQVPVYATTIMSNGFKSTAEMVGDSYLTRTKVSSFRIVMHHETLHGQKLLQLAKQNYWQVSWIGGTGLNTGKHLLTPHHTSSLTSIQDARSPTTAWIGGLCGHGVHIQPAKLTGLHPSQDDAFPWRLFVHRCRDVGLQVQDNPEILHQLGRARDAIHNLLRVAHCVLPKEGGISGVCRREPFFSARKQGQGSNLLDWHRRWHR